jgi:hypothetical protein
MSKRISQLDTMTDTEVADNDLIVIQDVSVPRTKSIQHQYLNPSFKISTQTGNYTITRDHEIVFASGDITITLAAASSSFHTRIVNVGTGTITVAISGADTIEGRTSISITRQYESIDLVANGASLYATF